MVLQVQMFIKIILAKNGIPDLNTFLPMTAKETMSKVGNIPLAFEPGTRWMYGLNTDVLGRVVEVPQVKIWMITFEKKLLNLLELKCLIFILMIL